MAAVTAVIHIRSGNNRSVESEIVAIHISRIAVAVIVLVGTPNLVLIDPHSVLEVGMSVINALIEHCNNNRRVACTQIPGLLHSDISPFLELYGSESAVIHQMPLIGKSGIIEIPGCGAGLRARLLGVERNGLAAVCLLETAVAVHCAHLSEARKFGIYPLHRSILVKTYPVPQV